MSLKSLWKRLIESQYVEVRDYDLPQSQNLIYKGMKSELPYSSFVGFRSTQVSYIETMHDVLIIYVYGDRK